METSAKAQPHLRGKKAHDRADRRRQQLAHKRGMDSAVAPTQGGQAQRDPLTTGATTDHPTVLHGSHSSPQVRDGEATEVCAGTRAGRARLHPSLENARNENYEEDVISPSAPARERPPPTAARMRT